MFEQSYSHPKSNALTNWYDKVMGKTKSTAVQVRARAEETLAERAKCAVVDGGLGVITGGTLAVIHANAPQGLDVNLKKSDPATGKGGMSMPVDAAVAVVGLAAGSAGIGAGAAGVFSFRKTMDLLAEKKAQSGQKPTGTVGVPKGGVHGDFGEDPILVAARGL